MRFWNIAFVVSAFVLPAASVAGGPPHIFSPEFNCQMVLEASKGLTEVQPPDLAFLEQLNAFDGRLALWLPEDHRHPVPSLNPVSYRDDTSRRFFTGEAPQLFVGGDEVEEVLAHVRATKMEVTNRLRLPPVDGTGLYRWRGETLNELIVTIGEAYPDWVALRIPQELTRRVRVTSVGGSIASVLVASGSGIAMLIHFLSFPGNVPGVSWDSIVSLVGAGTVSAVSGALTYMAFGRRTATGIVPGADLTERILRIGDARSAPTERDRYDGDRYVGFTLADGRHGVLLYVPEQHELSLYLWDPTRW